MNIFGSMSPWSSSPFSGARSLGQVPLVLGPSSWGAGIPMAAPAQPPFYGQWGIPGDEGALVDGGRVGPFDTIDEAFSAAAEAARDAGATKMPLDGFAQVVDSAGRPVGSVI